MFNRSEISFQYSLAPLSMSLAGADGTLRKTTPKSVFLHKLEKEVQLVTEYFKDSIPHMSANIILYC